MDEDILLAKDDGLSLPQIGNWALTKYGFVYEYNTLFSTGMKKKWDTRVYIDLFSGPGRAIIEKQNKIVNTSPILSLLVNDKYDRYIFCDRDEENISALKARVNAIHGIDNVSYLVGDCNLLTEQVVANIPKPSKDNTVLSFCFVDPFSLCINFDTIEKLSKYFMDFLVLLAFGMDGKRNIGLYIEENHKRIDNFLGLQDWRDRWRNALQQGVNLTKFLADEFTGQMVKLGYREEAINNFIPIRSDEKNLPLYYLAFFSRNPKGYEFWEKVKKRVIDPTLFD